VTHARGAHHWLAGGALLALAPCAATPLHAQGASPRVPAIVTRAPLDPSQGVNFHAVIEPDTVYVGEQATYQVGVFLDDDVRARLRRNPEFVPPEMRAMLAYELPTGHAFVPRPGGRGRYEVHVFERAVFPLAPGVLEIPGATLNYSLPLTASFFSREESHSARSQQLRLVALEPPAEGRPAGWQGAVGALAVDTRLDPGAARVGDPLLVTVRVRGRGNVNLFPRPHLVVPWGTAVPADERVRLDAASREVAGVKEFDWIITPRSAGQVVLPSLRYPYFDPARRRYEVAQTAPETLTVASGTLAALDTMTSGSAPLAVRREWRGERPLPPARRPWYWLAVILLPLPAGVAALVRRPRARRRVSTLGALARVCAAGSIDPRQLRRLFMRALGERLRTRDLAPTRRGAVARTLRREGVSGGVADAVETFLHELDAAAYGARPSLERGAGRRALELYERVDAEARHRGGAGVRPVAAFLLCAALAGAATGAAALAANDGARDAFARGVRHYETHEFVAARSAFARASALAPRAPDAWANLGTAAWAARDTAHAVQGWQRALRLEPLAADVRERLETLPASPGEEADVAEVPVEPLQWGALALWALASAAAMLALARRRRLGSPSVVLATGSSLAIGALALWVDARLAARDLGVVAAAGALRAAPAIGAEPRLTLATGEVVRVTRAQGVWVRVVVDDDRSGWVERERVLPLARD
jgi:tetratricopeptide (TPR) repeat protein